MDGAEGERATRNSQAKGIECGRYSGEQKCTEEVTGVMLGIFQVKGQRQMWISVEWYLYLSLFLYVRGLTNPIMK